jgi:hypothetical protein
MSGTLETLLVRIRDGSGSESDVSEARGLARHDARLPHELRSGVLLDAEEAPSDAAGLLAVLGGDDLFGDTLAEAVAWDLSVETELTDAELVELEDDWVWGPALAEAVRAEGGVVELTDAVMARVDRGISGWVYGPVLSEAVRREAGQVDVSRAVLSMLGEGTSPVAEAVRTEAGWVPDVDATTLLTLIGDVVRAEAGSVDVTGAVLAELDVRLLPVAEAVSSEAGGGDIAAKVLMALDARVLPVADAVRFEAGAVDVVSTVCVELGVKVLPVAAAVQAEAGVFDVSGQWAELSVAEAVRDESGSVDCWTAVQAEIMPMGHETAPRHVSMPDSIAAPVAIPAPANSAWSWGALLMAAIVLLVVGASQLIGGYQSVGPAVPAPMQFASASEIIVDELEWSDTVQVMQTEGDEGALIIWVDEEAT